MLMKQRHNLENNQGRALQGETHRLVHRRVMRCRRTLAVQEPGSESARNTAGEAMQVTLTNSLVFYSASEHHIVAILSQSLTCRLVRV